MTKLTYFPLDDDLIGPLTAGSVALTGVIAGYPGANTRTIEMGETARSAVPIAGGKLQFTFAAGIAPKFWALLNTNITAGDVTVRNYSDAFTTPDESRTISFRALDMKSYGPAMSNQRWWEIDVNGCTFADSFFEIGKVIAGLDVRTFRNDFLDLQTAVNYRNIYNETQGGVCYVHKLEKRRRDFSLSWNAAPLDYTVADTEELLEFTRGGASPFLLIPDNDLADLYYVRSSDSASWTKPGSHSFVTGLSLNFRELSRGRIQVEA